MRVLVVYGSESGGTRGIARTVRTNLQLAGHTAEVQPARAVTDLEGFEAVVVGGGLYAGRWHRDARRFVQRHADQLRTLPVFLFSSGPLDDSATERVIPPTAGVQRLMQLIGARDHITFGGRLTEGARGWLARRMLAGGMAGDFRDIRQIDRFSAAVAKALDETAAPVPAPGRWLARRRVQQVAGALCLFTGATASLGGLELMLYSRGGPWLPPLSILEPTPFASYLVPGLLLLCCVGASNLLASWWLARRHRVENALVMLAGCVLMAWTAGQMLLLDMAHWIQWTHVGLGAAMLVLGLWLEFEPSRRPRSRTLGSEQLHVSR